MENIFGEQLAQARAARAMTQVDLARRIGTKQPNVAKFESGDQKPGLTTLQALAGALGGEIVIGPYGVEIRLDKSNRHQGVQAERSK